MNAIILSIGDELILGQTIDTNSAWISQQLAGVGCDIAAHVTVPDDQKLIEEAIRDASRRCDLVIISGGIGPTPDDLTRQALAAVLNAPLELNEAWLAELRQFFRSRGREMPEANKIQAMIPRGAAMIYNACGTAAGMDVYLNEVCRAVVIPGVPKEMKAMLSSAVIPTIVATSGGALILSRTLHTFGLGESWVAEKLGGLMNRSRNPSVGTTVSQGIVSLRINARFNSRDEAQKQIDLTIQACREALGDIIYGEEEQTLAQVVAEMLIRKAQTENRKFTVTTAESCTGGLLAKMLTDIPGSSDYFKTGFVTYSNEAKHELLGVPMELIARHGAVSDAVVLAMAAGALKKAGADFALAISGIAGPTVGTAEKPVGTVCIGLAHTTGTATRTFHFPGDREMIRDRSAKMALSMLRFQLMGAAMPF
jgi:nicotinamide-nucleotide amidase